MQTSSQIQNQIKRKGRLHDELACQEVLPSRLNLQLRERPFIKSGQTKPPDTNESN